MMNFKGWDDYPLLSKPANVTKSKTCYVPTKQNIYNSTFEVYTTFCFLNTPNKSKRD